MATLSNGKREYYDIDIEDARAMAELWNEGLGKKEWFIY